MAPITNRMRVDSSAKPLVFHLRQTGLQDLIPRDSDLHVVFHNILKAIRFLETIEKSLRDVFLGFSGSKNVSQMLSIGVQAHSCNSEVDVKEVPVLDCSVVDGRCHLEDAFGPDDVDIGLEPRGVVVQLDFLAEPPFNVLLR